MRGFSLVELLVAIGITTLLVATGIPTFRSYGQRISLDQAAEDVAGLLITARTLALSPDAAKEKEVVAYGVAFDNDNKKTELFSYELKNNEYKKSGAPRQTFEAPAVVTSIFARKSMDSRTVLKEIIFPIESRGGSNTDAAITLDGGKVGTRTISVIAATGQITVVTNNAQQ